MIKYENIKHSLTTGMIDNHYIITDDDIDNCKDCDHCPFMPSDLIKTYTYGLFPWDHVFKEEYRDGKKVNDVAEKYSKFWIEKYCYVKKFHKMWQKRHTNIMFRNKSERNYKKYLKRHDLEPAYQYVGTKYAPTKY